MSDQELAITEEDMLWVRKILSELEVPQAQSITLEDLLAIEERMIEECLNKVYGERNGHHRLSPIEKRIVYIVHQNGK